MPVIPQRLVLIGAFAALYLIWGSTYLAIGIGVATWPPLLFCGVRFLLAGSLLYRWMRWRGASPPTAREWRSAILLSILMLGFGTGGVTIAQSLGAASGVAALTNAVVLNRFFTFGGEPGMIHAICWG